MATYLGGKFSGKNAQAQIRYSGLNVSSSMMDLPIAIFWGQRRLSTNAIWYNGFKANPVSAKGGGKGGSGGAKGGGQYDYTASVIVALGEGPIDSIVNVWAAGSTTTTTTLAKLNLTFFSGTAAQAPWAFVVTNYPTQARSYELTAYLACPKMDLGSSASIPDNAFECVRLNGFAYSHTTPGWINPTTLVQGTAVDVLMSDVITDLLTNTQYGALMSAGDLGSMTSFATYNRAQGLFFSPLLNRQEKATSVLDRWAVLTNSWIFWDGVSIRFVPLGDSTVTGNGATYTPDNGAAYNLGVDDFLGTIPIKATRKDPADCYNRTRLSISDRTLGYISNPLEYKDQTLVDQYGLRDDSSTQADDVCDPIVGQVIVQLLGKRNAYLRNTYEFKTSYRYIRIIPGTIVTITEPNIGLTNKLVRITKVEEDKDNALSFTAEEFPGTLGTYQALTTFIAGAPTTPNQLLLPGNVNTPAIVEPSSAFTQGKAVLMIAASGGANWGGANVHLSFDGTNYSKVGTISSPALQGVLTSGLASHADPDTTNTLAVDCTESLTTAHTVTHADADALRTLSLVAAQPTFSGGIYTVPTNGELLAFGTVTSTGTYTANLTYLRRGQYGSSPSSHSTGDQFTVIDVLGSSGTTLLYQLPPQYIGAPVYVKLTSLNAFGQQEQDISTVNEYKYTPTGAGFGGGTGGVPTTPTGLAAAPVSGQTTLTWTANPSTDNVTAYNLYAAPGLGQPFGSATLLWSGLGTNYVHTGLAGGATYTYFLTATNAVGSSTNTAGVNSTTPAGSGLTLTDNHIYVGNASNVATDVAMSGDATIVASGAVTLANSGVTAATYGDATHVPQITVDAKGRATLIANVAITGSTPALTDNHIFVGNASNVATDVAMSGDATIVASGALTLANTAVTPGSYGDSSHVGTFTVDSKGRLTAAGTAAITGGGGGSVDPSPFSDDSITKPVAANFTIANDTGGGFGSSAVTNLNSRGCLLEVTQSGAPASTQSWFYEAAVSNTLNTVTVYVQPNPFPTAGVAWFFGIGVRDSSNKIDAFGIRNNGTTGAFVEAQYTTISTVSSLPGGTAYQYPINNRPLWMRLQKVSTNFVFSVSWDGENYTTISTTSATAFVSSTLNDVGILIVNNLAIASSEFSIDCFSFLRS